MRPAGGEVVLFDGGGLDGWSMAGAGEFVIIDGALETRGGMGLLWYHERQFRDFVLSLEWCASTRTANAGVFVRFPDPEGDPWKPVHRGYEVQTLDEAPEPEQRTGAIYTFSGPETLSSHGPGSWNRMEIRAEEQEYTVTVNDRVVTRFHGDRETVGFVGLQNHDDGSRVQFRHVRVRDLCPA